MGREEQEIDIAAFASVMLAGMLLGFISHELVHLFLISNPTSITIWFGSSVNAITVCCLNEMENAFEEVAYFVQIVVTILWIIVNKNIYLKEMK